MLSAPLYSQTSVGIGLYPTGTEAGIGFRSGKNTLLFADARLTKATIFSKPASSSFISEVSAVFRLIREEKIRFHLGIGWRGEWNLERTHKQGAVIPVGVEAFPFPFQNAGLFFEVAPFFVHDMIKDYNAGLRTVAGFIFYFKSKKTNETNGSN